jgi:AhpD family alkylhydroperoxidase
MSRLSKLDIRDWDPELRAMYQADSATDLELGAMRMFAHRPEIGKGLIALGAGIRARGTLPERLMELVRLRVAFHNQCRSCMAIRYRSAVDAGVDEGLVCSLEKPMEAPDLTAAERAALAYADRFANDHLSIDEAMFAQLRQHYDDGELVELFSWIAFCVGFGRLGAVLDMTEELPDAYRDKAVARVTPWAGEPIVVR